MNVSIISIIWDNLSDQKIKIQGSQLHTSKGSGKYCATKGLAFEQSNEAAMTGLNGVRMLSSESSLTNIFILLLFGWRLQKVRVDENRICGGTDGD